MTYIMLSFDWQVSYNAVFDKLEPEAVKEGQKPELVTPLSLMISGFQSDERLDVKSRIIFTQTLRHGLLRRVAIEKALRDRPDVLKVSTIWT